MYRRLLRDYLSLTRGERRGMQVLSLLVIILLAFRAFIPLFIQFPESDLRQAEKEFIAFHDSILRLETWFYQPEVNNSRTRAERDSIQSAPFPFDPNTASLNELVSLGLSPHTSRTLINYRNAGGEFRRDSDLLRIYGLEKEEYIRIKDFIRIAPLELYPVHLRGEEDPALAHSGGGYFPERKPADSSGGNLTFELNRADSLQLLSVYGIGPVFARRIIRYREALGGYYSQNQLLEVYGLNPDQYREIQQNSYIDTGQLCLLDLNQADAGDLSRHPYLDRYQSNAIISYRKQMGTFESTDDLLINGILPDSVFLRIRPYLHTGGR